MQHRLAISVLLQTIALCFSSVHGSDCGQGYKDWELFNGNCYHWNGRIGSAYTWHQANKYCLDKGAHLASIHSDEENTFIGKRGFLSYHPAIWIGLNALGNDQAYFWTDGSILNFTRVNTTVVDINKGRCAALSSPSPDKYWLFMHCDVTGSLVCKRAPVDSAQTITPPVTTPWPGSCQPNWTRIGNKCFKLFSSKNGHLLNHSVALQQCKAMGPNHNLASLHNHNENVILTTLAAGEETNLWLGLSRITFTTFGWTDNTALEYTNWAPGEPSSVAEDCTEFITSKFRAGLWNDISCRAQMGYICQTYPDLTTTEVPPIVDDCQKHGSVKFGSSCYKMVLEEDKQTNWASAESSCQEFGGHLASVHSASEMAFFNAQLQTKNFRNQLWIGLQTDQAANLQWSDGWPVTFLNPSSPLKKLPSLCGYFNSTGAWNLGQCQASLGYVCKVTKDSPPIHPEADKRPCPKHVSDWLDVGLKHCYQISSKYGLWGSAALRCLQNDSNLASFHYQHEIDLLAPYISMSTRSYWIGKYRKHTGKFEWIDGVNSPVLDFWESGEPSTKDQDDCMSLSPTSFTARAKKCDESSLYICKISKG